MTTSRWAGIMAGLIMIAIVVPFTLLSRVHAWYGSFLLWALMGIVIIAFNAWTTRRFRTLTQDLEQDGPHE
ncbi:hypothetical protein SAMN05421848_3003 [Kushneria avicenniae]|uniref:Uncharacterized protein n=1 Tax=Kushneria avicenniae TaxID=402385 RepID=A0A1I1MLG6_9GAMM|nr:hypothetical protein [Kushneria avicenniae]SFC85672.1 hypothetical protein SAMN05421848_3003 [Kushneria avicenniae]